MSDGSPYLTVPEIAALARCHHNTVRRAIASGRLAAMRPAGRLLIREQDAHAWIEGSREPSGAPRGAVRRRGTVARLKPAGGW